MTVPHALPSELPVVTAYGYARVSSDDQSTELQRTALLTAGCDLVRDETASATSTHGRPELRLLLDFIRQGDELVVTRIDRLARSIADLQAILAELKGKGATLRTTEQPIDTSNAAGKAFLDMLGVFAEFETNLRRERQMEGIRRAKAKGLYRGRKATIDRARVRSLKGEGHGPAAIARQLGISRQSVYRVLAEA